MASSIHIQTAKAMRKKGIDIVNFGVGEPDFDTPDNIKDAAIKAVREGFTKYTPVGGIDALKDAIIDKFKTDNHMNMPEMKSLYHAVQSTASITLHRHSSV